MVPVCIESCCSSLHHFYFILVLLQIWIPNQASILHCWSYKGDVYVTCLSINIPLNTTFRSWKKSYVPCLALPLRVHKLYIRVSFSDTFLRWLPPFVVYKQLSLSAVKTNPFYNLLGSGCVLISYSTLSLIIAWLGQDYSSEADKETLLYCAVSDVSSRYVFSCVICFRFIHFILISTAHALFLTCLPVSIYGT